MSRSEPSHRQKNQNFDVNLKCKLRLELWPTDDVVTCACGQRMDRFGDHAFCCTAVKKTTMSNEIRDGIIRLFQRILPTVRMITTQTAVEKELPNLLRILPTIRPFDLSIKLDHLLGDSIWRSPLNRIGFDVYVISSNASTSTKAQTNKKKKSDIRLRDGEKEKFCRKGHTDKGSSTTLTGDEIIGEILNTNSALIPITVTEFGQFGSLFERFLFGREALKIPNFSDNQKNAKAAAKLARSTKVPHSVLPRANEIWRKEHEGGFFGHSYKAMDPLTYAEQQLGLITTTAIANHILRAHRVVKSRPPKDDESTKFGSLLFDGATYLSTDSIRYQSGVGTDACVDTFSSATLPNIIVQ